MKIKKVTCLLIMVSVFLLVSCTTSKSIQRIDPETTADLSQRWNDTDFRLASQNLVDTCLKSNWITRYLLENNGQRPTVIVGNIRNLTSDHIETSILSKKIEVALLNSGEVDTVADFSFRDDVRDEQLDQQYHASSETAAELGNETGADFILQGSIKLSIDQKDNMEIRSYYIDAELINIETAKKAWVGYYEIKKQVKRDKYSW